MKKNLLITFAVVAAALLIVYFLTVRKMKTKAGEGKQEDIYTRFLKDELKYGDDFLNRFSFADRKTLYELITEYSRKGRKVMKSDPIYNDVMRIKSYAPELYIQNVEV